MALTPEDEDTVVERLTFYNRTLEKLLAMLVVQWGTPHSGGYRLVLDDEDAAAVASKLGTLEPVVVQRYDDLGSQYVIDVL